MNKAKGPRILLLDIETSPLISYSWGLWDQNIALNQVIEDSHILSFAAKWHGSPENEVYYMDQSRNKKIIDDKRLLKEIRDLVDQADIVVGHNSKQFDVKKLNAAFLLVDIEKPSSYKQIDTLTLAKKYFNFTSNKLEYLSNKLCKNHKKSQHKKFPGFELWRECLNGNKQAWKEMKNYNIQDVHSLEEVYNILSSWDDSINFSVYYDTKELVCSCGSREFKKNGFRFTSRSKFQRYKCVQCNKETSDTKNLLV